MRKMKSLMLSAALVAGMIFSGGQALADPYPYCQLLSPQAKSPAGPSLKDLLDKKITNPDELVAKILDPVAPLKPEDLEKIYKEVYSFVIEHYVDDSKLDRLAGYEHKYDGKLATRQDLDRAIDDLILQMGDRWTWVASASKHMTGVLNALSKQVSFGIALRLEKDGSFWVEHLEYGSTAQLSGLREGDVIVAVNERELKGLSKDEAEKLLVGPVGASLKVKSVQDGKSVETSYTLRAPVANETAANLLKNNIAYLKLPSFMSEEDFGGIIEAMTGMAQGTPGGLQGIILDLRYNGGGRVDFAKSLISLLLSQGVVINETSREGRTRLEQSTSILPLGAYGKLKFSDEQLAVLKDLQALPLVILVNGSSASASEIVTGALKESRPNTTVIGERSFGKFEEMLVTTLPNCSTVAVTSARYTTPTGKWLHNVGIVPDITVHQPRDSQDDAQLAAAVDLLEKKTGMNPGNIVRMNPEDQPILGPVPQRPQPTVDTDWTQLAREHRSLIMQGAVGVLLGGLLIIYLLLSKGAGEDSEEGKLLSREKTGKLCSRFAALFNRRKS